MQERKLRIVKKAPPPAIGVCQRCNTQSKSNLPHSLGSLVEIKARFLAHECKPMDSSQNDLRIVREAREDK